MIRKKWILAISISIVLLISLFIALLKNKNQTSDLEFQDKNQDGIWDDVEPAILQYAKS